MLSPTPTHDGDRDTMLLAVSSDVREVCSWQTHLRAGAVLHGRQRTASQSAGVHNGGLHGAGL